MRSKRKQRPVVGCENCGRDYQLAWCVPAEDSIDNKFSTFCRYCGFENWVKGPRTANLQIKKATDTQSTALREEI